MLFYFFELIRSPSSSELAATFTCSLIRRNRRRRRRGGERLRGCSDIKRCLFFFLSKLTKTFFPFLTFETCPFFFLLSQRRRGRQGDDPGAFLLGRLALRGGGGGGGSGVRSRSGSGSRGRGRSLLFPLFLLLRFARLGVGGDDPPRLANRRHGKFPKDADGPRRDLHGDGVGACPAEDPRQRGSVDDDDFPRELARRGGGGGAPAVAQSPPALTNLTLPLEEGEMRGRSSWTMAAKAEGAPKMKVVRERSG